MTEFLFRHPELLVGLPQDPNQALMVIAQRIKNSKTTL